RQPGAGKENPAQLPPAKQFVGNDAVADTQPLAFAYGQVIGPARSERVLDVEVRNGAVAVEVVGVLHRAFGVGDDVNRLAEGVGVDEHQTVGEAVGKLHEQRVVVR